MGGLFTQALPQDLPEGSSPRNYNVDFITGSVFQRAGLASVYTYASVLNITSLTIGSGGVGVFGFSGGTVVINEEFLLAGFQGNNLFLNGQNIYVLAVNTLNNTFSAYVEGSAGTYIITSGQATSITGQFLGPNAPTVALDVPVYQTPWTNVNGILGNISYSSVLVGQVDETFIPTTVTTVNIGGVAWLEPQDVTSDSSYAQVLLNSPGGGLGATSKILQAVGGAFVPFLATIKGVEVNITASAITFSGSTNPALNMFLISSSGNSDEYSQAVPIGGFSNYTFGSPTFSWGIDLNAAFINNGFGVGIIALGGTGVNALVSLNNLTITVYYTTVGSDFLQAKTFNFSVQPTNGITGIQVTYQAYSNLSGNNISIQLMKNGEPLGIPVFQSLTTEPTTYSAGNNSFLWGSTWEYSDVNNLGFGIQVIAYGTGVVYINDADVVVYITPSLANFNYIKTFEQDNGDILTFALDSFGNLWKEDATNTPNVITLEDLTILPGSFAKSATADDQEYIMFSDLTIGTDRPRVASTNEITGLLQYLPLSQCGPGAPPSFQASVGNGNSVLAVTAYSISGGVVTFTFTVLADEFIPAVGSLYVIAGTGNINLDGLTFTVLGTPAPTDTSFAAAAGIATGSASALTATATPSYSIPIASITQAAAINFNGQEIVWSEGPSSSAPGSVVTFWYAGPGQPENPLFLSNDAAEIQSIVYISGIPSGAPGNGTWAVQSHGIGNPPHESGGIPYFTIQFTSSNYQNYGSGRPSGPGNDGNFQFTLATLTTATATDTLTVGGTFQITDVTTHPSWNGNWTCNQALTSGTLNIISSQIINGGSTVQYGFIVQSGNAPVNGELVAVQGLTNAAFVNTTGVVSAATGSTFQIDGFPGGGTTQSSPTAEDGQASTFGTQFTFDPGANQLSTTTPDPIFGNDSGQGLLTIIGGTVVPVGSGTRQAVVFFITDSGLYTQVSPPVVFTTTQEANFILASKIPIGPPNVKGRGIAFTEAGQNGVPGANFYIIPQPITITVNGTTTIYTSTIINDNVSETAQFTFTDAVLLDAEAIDIQGNDLFNLIELGSSAWCLPYASRMFYGLQLNKINNWTTGGSLTFDAGYLSESNQPLGWSIANPQNQKLVESPVTGDALYMFFGEGSNADPIGLIYQTAYQDPYQQPIILPNTTYSVRVACSNPSSISQGTLVIDLTDYNSGSGFGQTYGSFSLPLSDMTSNVQVFTGTLLTSPFVLGVSSALQIRVYISDIGLDSDCLIDRIEVFPTVQPYITAQVYGSYINDLEAIDASGSGGIIDTSTENPQPCYGGFVMHDEMYLLKKTSWYATQNTSDSEPGGWSLREVSNKVGTCGINAFDTGEEWALTACRAGIYGFNGGEPIKIMQELWNLWETINWDAGHTIWLRNDIVNKRMLCAVPLPTGTNPTTGIATATIQWLPNAPYNPAPTSPNVMLMLNYQAFSTFDEMISGMPVHATMFGTLAAPDLRRKWSIWLIPSPYADFITRQDGLDQPLFICNGIDSSKIYQFENNQTSDDGVAIDTDYVSYGFVNATKAATIPIFGMHRKQYSVFQTTMEGEGVASVTLYPDTLGAKYPITIPGGIYLNSPAQQDYFRPINVTGNRMFIEVRTNAVDSWFQLDKLLITGRSAPWSSLNPLGGGNRGIVAGAQ